MQLHSLSVSSILHHAAKHHGSREIVARVADGHIETSSYAQLECRARAVASLLRKLGVSPGERVSTLAWNGLRHLELFYGVAGAGVVLHTANPRLLPEQIAYTIEHTGCRALFFEPGLADLAGVLKPLLPSIEHWFALDSAFEVLLDEEEPIARWPELDERQGAYLCYTSGTTGMPKGVLYSHRAILLHALSTSSPTVFDVHAIDTMMPCASMYHATAWGWPFVAPMNGAKLVLPYDRMDAPSLSELITSEQVTISGGVPTIWTNYLRHLEATGGSTGALRLLCVGGSAVPQSLERAMRERYGVTVRQLWGMTEAGPIGLAASAGSTLSDLPDTEQANLLASRQGRAIFGADTRVVDENGCSATPDGMAPGRLEVRGHWVIDRYYRQEALAVDESGWLDTGDIAAIDARGFVRITDRAKDVIKSGGEWISSVELENAMTSHPAVIAAAVIGVAHPRWEERPLLIVELAQGQTLTIDEMHRHLHGKVARWWYPDEVVEASIPLTATGKIDKKLLRDRYRDRLLPTAERASSA